MDDREAINTMYGGGGDALWTDRDMEEQKVYDHQKENGGLLVGVPSMEEMDKDEAAAAAAAAAAMNGGSVMNGDHSGGGSSVGSHPIYAGLHELTSSGASAVTTSSAGCHPMPHDPSASSSLLTGNGTGVGIAGNGGPSVLDPHSHPTMPMGDHTHHLLHHHHQVGRERSKLFFQRYSLVVASRHSTKGVKERSCGPERKGGR